MVSTICLEVVRHAMAPDIQAEEDGRRRRQQSGAVFGERFRAHWPGECPNEATAVMPETIRSDHEIELRMNSGRFFAPRPACLLSFSAMQFNKDRLDIRKPHSFRNMTVTSVGKAGCPGSFMFPPTWSDAVGRMTVPIS